MEPQEDVRSETRPDTQADLCLGEMIELRVGTVCAGGGFVARAPDGRVVFVRHAIEGELVRAQITEVTRNYLRADAIEIMEPSSDRVTPPCEFSGPGRCGGCDYQHLALSAQRRVKADRIEEQLSRLAGLSRRVVVEPVPGDREGLAWRTRVGYGVNPEGIVGLHRYRSHDLEPITHCLLATPEVTEIGVEEEHWPGVREINAFSAPDGKSKVLDLDTGRRPIAAVPRMEADLVINREVHIGRGRVAVEVLGRRYTISPGVFWQVHPGAPATLASAVLEGAGEIGGARVLDLYCGAGLFSALLGRAVGSAGEVIGIERDRRACSDARHNTADLSMVSVMEASVTAATITSLGQPPTVAVLDPAREGAGAAVISALCQMAPALQRIVYVSCDPATFARDVATATSLGWELGSLRAFDLFPMTEHVELVGVLTPKD